MSKGLEALEKLTNYKCSRMSEKIECKEIIEKELKRLETLDSGAFVCIHVNRYDELQKKEQALEIIKKLLIIDDDKQRIDVKNCVEMSDDEYELLKEVLK